MTVISNLFILNQILHNHEAQYLSDAYQLSPTPFENIVGDIIIFKL